MPANIPNLSAVHAVGQQFTHNPFKAASKGLNRVSNNQVAAATRQRAAAREAYYSDAMSTIRNGRQAFGQQQRQAASASRTMQQQRNYAHGQAIAEQKRRDRQTGAPASAPSAPAATFSHAPQAQSPSQGQQQMFSHGPSGGSITPQRIPQATFSHQFSGGGQQSPSAAATPTFSHGGAPTPTASVPRSPRGVTSMQFSHPEE